MAEAATSSNAVVAGSQKQMRRGNHEFAFHPVALEILVSPPCPPARALGAMQQQYLLSQTSEHQSKIAALDRQLAQKEAERATAQATIAKIQALIPLLQQQVEIRKTLFEHETGSRVVYLQTLQQLVEQ